jgi:secreted trypsin-like serine protease
MGARTLTLCVALAVLAAGALPAAATATAPVAETSIVNGRPVDITSYPWLGALLNDTRAPGGSETERFACGVSLIAPTIVLTAAHCVTDRATGAAVPAQPLHIRFGMTRLDAGGGETIDVTAVVRDPDYDTGTYSHDIALLVLARAPAAAPVRLAPLGSQLREGRKATIVGWGATGEGEPASQQLLTAQVPLWSNARCYRAYSTFLPNHEPSLQLCAAKRRGGVDTCQGDSGGPLILRSRGQVSLVGVVSFGNGCARRGWPGIYAWAASPFIQPWIVRRVRALTTGDPDVVAPAVTGFGLAGRQVGYTVSEPAEVIVAIQRRFPGGVRITLSTALIQNAAAGRNAFRLPRSLRGRRLAPGRYVLRATALDGAGNRSGAVETAFRVR